MTDDDPAPYRPPDPPPRRRPGPPPDGCDHGWIEYPDGTVDHCPNHSPNDPRFRDWWPRGQDPQ